MLVQAATTTATAAPAIGLTDLIVAGIGVGGVLVGALLQIGGNEIAWRRQQGRQQLDENRDRRLAAVAVAEHLETYVLHCNEVVSSWANVEWESPYEWNSYSGDGPVAMTPLPEWPDKIDWSLLGADAMVEGSNFKRFTELMRMHLDGASAFNDGEDQHLANANQAAALLLQAWEMASALRTKHRLAALVAPEGWDLTHAARSHIEQRAKIVAAQRKAHDAMWADLTPPEDPPKDV